MSDHKNVLLGLLIIGGAYMYTRSKSVQAATYTAPGGAMAYAPPGNPTKALGIGSMPGSVGTGPAQALGGLIGNLFSAQSGGGTTTGAPVTNTSAANDYNADYILQNNVPASDPNQTFDPTGGNTMGGAIFNSMSLDPSLAYA